MSDERYRGCPSCPSSIKIPHVGDFYFLADQNNDHNHPIPVQPKIQLARRTRIISCLFLLVWRASHAGVKMIVKTIMMATAYLMTNKISVGVIIIYVLYMPYFALSPSSSWIRNNWLYFAMRSVRDIEPVLICPALVATAKSAIVVSSVSPLRCEMTTPYFAS